MHLIACALCDNKIRGWNELYMTSRSLVSHIQREHPNACSITIIFKKGDEDKEEPSLTDPLEQFLAARAWMVENNHL